MGIPFSSMFRARFSLITASTTSPTCALLIFPPCSPWCPSCLCLRLSHDPRLHNVLQVQVADHPVVVVQHRHLGDRRVFLHLGQRFGHQPLGRGRAGALLHHLADGTL